MTDKPADLVNDIVCDVSVQFDDELPAYEETASNTSPPYIDAPPDINARLPPETLYLSDRLIRSKSPNGTPVYEFSHHVVSLKELDRKVVMEKVTTRIRQGQLKTHNSLLYHLKHPTPGEFPAFNYLAEKQSQRALSSLGIEKQHSLLKSRYRFVQAKRGPNRGLIKAGKDFLFEAAPCGTTKKDGVNWIWTGADKQVMAREVMQDGVRSLVVSSEMTSQMRDALVASWYLRIWWIRGQETSEAPSPVERAHRITNSKTGIYAGFRDNSAGLLLGGGGAG